MALPVNKRTLDKTIETTLATNNTQAITATVLQNALTPIVNSTFGLKTIWAGNIRSYDYNDGGSSVRNVFNVIEDYYDPNYFPSLNPTDLLQPLASYQQVGNRYRLNDVGSGLGAATTVYGVTTTLIDTPPTSHAPTYERTWRPPHGLTFDVKIGSGGTVDAIIVNNPGTGYYWTGANAGATLYPLTVQLNMSGTTLPNVQIDLSRVIRGYRLGTQYGNPPTLSYNGATADKASVVNFYIDGAGSTIGFGTNIKIIESESPVKTGETLGAIYQNVYSLFGQYNSAHLYNTVISNPSGGSIDWTGIGYYAIFPYVNASGIDWANYNRYVEIKVPIIKQT